MTFHKDLFSDGLAPVAILPHNPSPLAESYNDQL